MKKCLTLLFLLLLSFLEGKVANYWFTEYFSPQHSSIELAQRNLIKYSERISSDSLIFIRDKDYEIDYSQGLIKPISAQIKLQEQLKIDYKVIPKEYLEPLFLYRIEMNADSTFAVKKRETKNLFLDENKLLINGSKTFAISFSDKKDFDINQSLYLKLSGEIASNLFVEAQLSDSNSPISVEGGSSELSSLDRVFISIFNDNFELSFGDLSHEITNTSFINYLAQFDGLKLGLFENKNNIYTGNFGTQNSFWGALAVSQGKNSSYRFTCVEGKQGPYYIYISDSNEFVSIIANSEVVYIDGVRVTRGVDYFIDYSEGSLTFERLVTSETEIYVTFEYSDEKYRNNLYIASGSYRITDYLNLKIHALHRGDDKNNPLEDIHTEEDMAAFAEAGDSLIFANGVYEVEIGEGNYIAETNSEGEVVYSYVGLDNGGNYNIYFSYVGEGEGSYILGLPNEYEYVGFGNGDYQPVRKLLPPQRLSNYDVLLRFGLEPIYLELETLLTDYDQNTLSSLEDSDNQGNISKISLNLNHQEEVWTTRNNLSLEYKSKHLKTFADLENPLELSYGGSETSYDSLKSKTMQANSEFSLKEYARISFLYKQQQIPTLYESDLLTSYLILKEHLYSPEVSYYFTNKSINYDLADWDSYSYSSHSFELGKRVGYVGGKFALVKEKSEDKLTEEQKFGYKYDKESYSLNSYDLSNVTLSSTYWLDRKSNLVTDHWTEISSSQTTTNNLLLSFNQHNSNVEYTFRKVDSKVETEEDNIFNMIRINSTHTMFNNGLDLNYNYKINNLEFYPQVRKLQYVGDELGDYDEFGDYQEDGDYEWLYVNSGEPELSTELNLGLNSYLRLNRFTDAFFVKNLTAEFRTILTEDSNTSEKLKLYLLDPSVIMNSNTTLYGRNNTQTSCSFSSENRKFNYKFSLEWDNVLDNRYQDANRTKIKIIDNEMMLRRFEFGNAGIQFTFREEKETQYSSLINEYATTLKYQNTFLQNYIYNGNFKLKLEDSQGSDDFEGYNLRVASFNNVLTANLAKKYLIQVNNDLIYTQNDGENGFVFLPEKKEGFSTKWNVSAKYNYNQYITVNLSYFGNKYPQTRMENNFNLEIKAEF